MRPILDAKIANCSVRRPSWEADSSSAFQEIFYNLGKPKVHHREYQPGTRSPPEPHKYNPRRPVLFTSKVLLVLFSYLSLDPPSFPFLPGFPTKTPYVFPFSPYVPHSPPISSSSDYHSTILCGLQTMKLLTTQFSPFSCNLLRPNVFLSTFSSNTLSLRPSLNATAQYANTP